MLLASNGEAVSPENRAEDVATPSEQPAEQKQLDDLLARPYLGITADGILTLHIPFTKTNEITARGMVDIARSRVLEWYAKQARAQADEQARIAALAAKTGYQRFKDLLVRRK